MKTSEKIKIYKPWWFGTELEELLFCFSVECFEKYKIIEWDKDYVSLMCLSEQFYAIEQSWGME